MQKIAIFLTFILYSFPLLSQAEISAEPKTSVTHSPDKKQWMQNVQQDLPPVLCEKERYFVQCFQVTEEECVDFTRLLVKACLSNIALGLPQDLDQQQGEYWGQMVGRCSYDLYEKFMRPKKRDLEKCRLEDKKNLPKPIQEMP